MSELTIPAEATDQKAAKLVQEFLEVGDEVEVRGEEMTEADRVRASGEVVEFDADGDGRGYLAVDDQSAGREEIYYDEIKTVSKLDAHGP